MMKKAYCIILCLFALILMFPASAASLVARYEFENNVNDTTGTYNGTAYNGPTYVAGIVGSYAIHLDGTDDYVQITRPVADNFTIALWVKTTQTAGTGQWWAGAGLIDGDTSSSSRDFGTSLVGSKFAFGVGGTDTTITSITSINDSQWHHVTAVRTKSSGSFSIYVDGVLENTATTAVNVSLNRPTYLRIGGIQTGATGSFFNGDLDDVRLYDYVLSQSEISTLAGVDTDPPTPNPATWAAAPYATGSDTIVMTAATGSDPRGIVKYYFQETSGNPGGNNSGWIDIPTYANSGLKPMNTYTYVVQMKDAFGNITADSQPASATTGPIPDMDGNDIVNLADFAKLAQEWLQTDCQNTLWCDGTDLDMNGTVGTSDLLVLARAWLESYAIGHFYTWASTPPMGWNSYDCYGYCVYESQVRANADYEAQYLKQYGWNYVVVDFCWYVPDVGITGVPNQNSSFVPHSSFDEYGRLLPNSDRFPSSVGGAGFKPLADYVHSLGLKFGIHLMRGIPKEVVASNLPIKGTSYTASQAANTSSTCSWYNLMYGLNMSHPAAQAYLNSIFELYASWGVDFVKIDDLSYPYYTDEVEGYRNAIDQCERPIVMSTSPGPTPLVNADHVSTHANMWRLLGDLWDNWSQVDNAFGQVYQWRNYFAPGHWPDLDMLPMGKLSKYGPVGSERYSALTQDECYTLMSLWCITRSPLMFGGNLPENNAFTTEIITNHEVIAVNQNSTGNRPVYTGTYPVWVADIPNSSDDKYLAVFNRSATGPTAIQVTLADIGVKRCLVRDLWTHTDLGEYSDTFTPQVNAHGAKLFKLTVLETAELPDPNLVFVLNNSGFDDQVLGDGSWSAAADVWSWNSDAGGNSHAQNLTTSAIDPASQSGENTCGLNQGAWIGQNLTYNDGSPVVIAANKTCQISVWVGRRLGTEGSAAGILSVYLEDAGSNTQIAGITYDLLNQGQGTWTQQTFQLSTGTNPSGAGNPLRLGFMNTGTRGAEHWYGQVVIDSVTLTDISSSQ
jgi:alpha-galactosidase